MIPAPTERPQSLLGKGTTALPARANFHLSGNRVYQDLVFAFWQYQSAMRTNKRMQGYLADWKSDESKLSSELSRILSSGFVEESGCVFLASQGRLATATRNDQQDDTGYECFVNHVHVKTLAEALEFAQRLKGALTEHFSDRFVVILAFDGDEATVRFHKHRADQAWLNDNLEGYLDEGIAVFD